MLSIEVSVSGSQVGRMLQSDPEELAYALSEVADEFWEGLPGEVVEVWGSHDRRKVSTFLKAMLAAIGDVEG